MQLAGKPATGLWVAWRDRSGSAPPDHYANARIAVKISVDEIGENVPTGTDTET